MPNNEDNKKEVKNEPNSEVNKEEIDKTKVFEIKNRKQKKGKNGKRRITKKTVKRVLLIFGLLILILAGIGFGIIYGAFKEAKLDSTDLALKYENSVVLDKDGNLKKWPPI